MREFPLVSIITPCTRPNFLPRAIQSIQAQTYQNFEVIVVNDGGEDLGELIQSFQDDRLRYFQHAQRLGPGATRNTGFRQAQGKYIAYLDDDDFYYPTHLQTLVEFLEQSDYQIAYTNGYCSWQVEVEATWQTYKRLLLYYNNFNLDQFLVDCLFQTNALMHHRECQAAIGFFDEDLQYHEDWDFWLRLALKYPFHHLPEITYEYTTRTGTQNLRTRWHGEFLSTMLVVHNRYRAQSSAAVQQQQAERRRQVAEYSLYEAQHKSPAELANLGLNRIMQRMVETSHLLQNTADQEMAHQIAIALVNRLPDNADLWCSLAQSFRFLNQPQAALEAIEQSLARQETATALAERIHVLQALGQTEAAIAQQQAWKDQFPHLTVPPDEPIPQPAHNTTPPPRSAWLAIAPGQPRDLRPRHYPLPPGNQLLWQRDPVLESIGRELEQFPQRYRAISFDFFDTLVARFAGEPVDVFIEVGRRLATAGLLTQPISPAAFRNLRIAAEKQAREQAWFQERQVEITIAQIYDQLQAFVREPEQAIACEIQVEREWCYLNPCTVDLLRSARQRGLRVVILSDTYYSADDLKSILVYHHFDLTQVDLLLTSADQGVVKGSGDLFRLVTAQLQLDPSALIHIGDNPNTDIRGAQQVGAFPVYYYRTTPYIDEVLQRERRLTGNSPTATAVDSLRVLAQRLQGHGGLDQAYYQDGAFLLGPVLARFADWCVDQFHTAGVTRVLALMREGELLGRLVERAAIARQIPLEVVRCYTSRQATNLASLGEVTPISLARWISGRRTPATILTVLEQLGLPRESLDDQFTSVELTEPVASVPERFNRLLTCLSTSPLTEQIQANSAAARELALGYLDPLVGDQTQIGLLDLGWNGTIQQQLVDIWRYGDRPLRVLGCYLATHPQIGMRLLRGLEMRTYLGTLGESDELTLALIHSGILEQAVNACVGSTERYHHQAQQVEPVLGPLRTSEAECQQKLLLQEGVLIFQHLWLQLQQTHPLSAVQLAEIDRLNQAIVHRLIAFPTRGEASRFGGFHHDDNFGSDSWTPLCNAEAQQALRNGGVAEAAQHPSTFWVPGLLALERPGLLHQLSTGWQDPAALGPLGAWTRYRQEILPYTTTEQQVLESLIQQQLPQTLLLVHRGNTAIQHWLRDSLPSESLLLEVAQEPGQPQAGTHHDLLVGTLTAPELLQRLQQRVAQLPTHQSMLVYLDSSCSALEIAHLLAALTPVLPGPCLLVLGHGHLDSFELNEPYSPRAQGVQWLATQGQSVGFQAVDLQAWARQLFTLFQRTPPVEATDLAGLNLREVNWIVFPDWSQSEEDLQQTLSAVILALLAREDSDRTTLLIESSALTDEDADLVLSSLLMQLMLEHEVEVTDLEVALTGNLSPQDWQALLPRLQARIQLESENQSLIATHATELPVYSLPTLTPECH